MATQTDIAKYQKDYDEQLVALMDAESTTRLSSNFVKFGLATGLYVGARALNGGLFETLFMPADSNPQNLWQVADMIGVTSTLMYGFIMGLASLVYKADEGCHRKDFQLAKDKLQKVVEDYQFERGHI